MANPVLTSTFQVYSDSASVLVNKDIIHDLARSLSLDPITDSLFPFEQDSRLSLEQSIALIVVTNSLNFCYWGDPKWQIDYNGVHDGYEAMVNSLQRAIDEGCDIRNPAVLSDMTLSKCAHLFRGNTDIPLLAERAGILREVGNIITTKFQGRFSNLYQAGLNDALTLLDVITCNFPSFDDYAFYNGKRVEFHKRAQLVVRGFSSSLNLPIDNLDQLTAFADYKVPQILSTLGVLQYSDDLKQKILSKTPIPARSKEEIEIRACTVWAVELLRQALQERKSGITSAELDYRLWLESKKRPDLLHYHRTLTTDY